jgi:hypothetical protein
MGMGKMDWMKKGSGLGLGAVLAAAALGAWACAFQEDVSEDGGLAVFVTDSSRISLDFDDLEQTVFEDSGEFSLEDVRKNLQDKGLNLSTVTISTLVVTYDDSTKKFLEDNQGLDYNLKIFVKEKGDTAAPKLALVSAGTAPGDTTLEFNPTKTSFAMGTDLAVDAAGFPSFIAAIQDTSKKIEFVLARLTVPGKLKATGKLNLNMVVTVGAKP